MKSNKLRRVKRAFAMATLKSGLRSGDKQLVEAGRDLLRKGSLPHSAQHSSLRSSSSEQNKTKIETAQAAERFTRNVIRALEGMTDTLSGDDSGLESIWDEICVQIQHEESPFWYAYDEIVRGLIGRFVAELSDIEREGIWLQTEASCEETDAREPKPLNRDEIIDYLVRDLYSKAADSSNDRIDSYFARNHEVD